MDINSIKDLDKKYYMNTFGDRIPVSFEKGDGIKLWGNDGKTYVDLFAGVAVSVLGHSHPKLVDAICQQAKNLLHCSNYYYIENQSKLAELLVNNSFADKVFFTNSGAESNEGAIKLARAYFSKQGQSRYKIISFNNSFHGRTLATVAATGQEKFQIPFRPMPEGFIKIDQNDLDQLKAVMTDDICAIMLEPIMGEGGVLPLDKEYAKQVRKLCDEKGILLIADEVQTGFGRTGSLFAYEHFNIKPDIMTLAKALGGGIPIGAILATDSVAKAFSPGDHGTTFGGGPLACAAGLAVVNEVLEANLSTHAQELGNFTINAIKAMSLPCVKEVRGLGLMIGIELEGIESGQVKSRCFDKGYLIGVAGQNTIRLLPPLIVSKADIMAFLQVLEDIIKSEASK